MISEEKKKVLQYFTQGRKLYKLQNFPEAVKYFAAALKLDPNDGPSKEYLKRCKEFVENPPPEDWDGVYVMKTK
jgi:tetratricopeptide (TPR) repeat protein